MAGRNPGWSVPGGTPEAPGSGPRVVVPKSEETDRLMEEARNGYICGHCRHVRLREGQEQFKDERLFEQLFDKLSYGHNKDWYGRTDMFALCGYWDGHMVHLMSPRRIPRHFLDSSCTYANKDESVQCPRWEPKGAGGTRGTPHYIGKRRNNEE